MDDRDRTKGPADERLEGVGEEIKGKVQQAVGDLTDDERLAAEGEANEGKGKLRQTMADIQQTVENAKDRFTR